MHIKLATTALLLLIFSLPVAAQDFKVTLLGTGDPIPRLDRFGPATLVEVGGQELLFDVGRGASQRLVQMNIALSALDAVFLTHFHHDHLVGLPDLWMTGWIPPPFGRRSVPTRACGFARACRRRGPGTGRQSGVTRTEHMRSRHRPSPH